MQVASVVNFFRTLVNSVGGASARVSDATAITYCDRATKWVVSDILFPESRLTLTTIAGQQAYPLPDLYQIQRVYVAGQPIVPTDLFTLEGDQIGIYDQSGSGVIPTGGDGPPGATFSAPAWAVQTAVAYPFVNNWGQPAPSAQPWFAGQRARYYLRGGSIGIVPPPGNAVTLTIDGVVIPATVANLTDNLLVPDNFTDAIAWKMASYLKFADQSPQSGPDSRNFASQMAMQELRALRTWKRQYTGDNSGPKVMTYRGSYHIGGYNAGSWGGDDDF